ncbi:HM13 [Cordylochernes scorpioides]|uniref:HM13 n=1 Tax=Cordylochernes scorpioides TaxID=51811 RepID=A0ABY6L0H3_9ARAC|nr:HM13 [Cordylochernes scorpioides]
MSSKDVALFPLIASGALLGLYIVFKVSVVPMDNLIIGAGDKGERESYFSQRLVAGVPARLHQPPPDLLFLCAGDHGPDQCHYSEPVSVMAGIAKMVATTLRWTLLTSCLLQHWIANDLLGIAFSLNGIELLQLNSVVNGCILLGGLFVYDVFWQWCHSGVCAVMFPQDLPEQGLAGSNFAILGLGDIVIPGIFLALLLRFDTSLKRRVPAYFITGFLPTSWASSPPSPSCTTTSMRSLRCSTWCPSV